MKLSLLWVSCLVSRSVLMKRKRCRRGTVFNSTIRFTTFVLNLLEGFAKTTTNSTGMQFKKRPWLKLVVGVFFVIGQIHICPQNKDVSPASCAPLWGNSDGMSDHHQWTGPLNSTLLVGTNKINSNLKMGVRFHTVDINKLPSSLWRDLMLSSAYKSGQTRCSWGFGLVSSSVTHT